MRTVVLIAPWVIDGSGQEPIRNGAVMMEGQYITYVGPANGVRVGPEVDRLHLDGCTLLPGLIDAHVHLTLDGAADVMSQALSDDAVSATIRAVQNLERNISAGITTVRDCGCPGDLGLAIVQAVRKGLVRLAPRVLAAGPALCITGGHGWFIGREVDGSDEMRKAVRQLIKKGADFVKLVVTGGVLTPGVSPGALQMSPAEIEAAVAEARSFGRMVAAHAHGADGIKAALRAGVHTIEHASYLDEEALALFRDTGAIAVSTLLASVRQVEHLEELPSYVAEKIMRHIDCERQSIRELIASGIPVAAGTDAGTPFNRHGDLVEQMLILHELGLPSLRAIQAATQIAARALGLENEIGTLEAGKYADIIAVEGNAAEDLRCIRRIVHVWKAGERLI